MLVVEGGEEHLLSPVAQDVGHERRVGFGAVVAVHASELDDGLDGLVGPVVLRDGCPIQQFAVQVAIPPYSEVERQASWIGNHLALGIEDAVGAEGPHLVAGMGRVDVGCHATTAIPLISYLTQDSAGAGIAQRGAGAVHFVTLPDVEVVVAR